MQRKTVDVRAVAAAVITADDLALTTGGMPSSSGRTPPRIDTSSRSYDNSVQNTPVEMKADGRHQKSERNPYGNEEPPGYKYGEIKHHKDGTMSYSGIRGTWAQR
jgi:hypothetical protein